jgi:hypothetical protein
MTKRWNVPYRTYAPPAPTKGAWQKETLVAALLGHTGKLAAADAWKIIGKRYWRTQDDCFRLGRVMRELGWQRTMRRFGGSPISAYARGTPAERRVTLYVFQCPIIGDFTITPSTSPIDDEQQNYDESVARGSLLSTYPLSPFRGKG